MNEINLNEEQPGVFLPEAYYISGETDYTNAFQAAVNAANSYVIYSNDNNLHRNAVIKLQPGKYYEIRKGYILNYGVSIDGQGATLAPIFSENVQDQSGTYKDYPKYEIGSEVLRYVFVVNMKTDTSNSQTVVKVIDFIYPWVKDSFIKNLQVRVYDGCNGTNKGRLGFVLLGAPMTISEIATYNVCPVVDTSITIAYDDDDEKVCYLDGIKIDHVRSNYDDNDTAAVCPYVIRKRCNGDGMVINQLINECGDFSSTTDSQNKKNYGLCIDNTYGLRICNCIHADGLIRFCSDVTYESNHNERGSLTIHYTNISIYNCRFHKPLNEPAIIISEYNWSGTASQCFHTVLLEGVVFVLQNDSHYNSDFEEIRFCGNNATRLYYKNVQVTTFLPVPAPNTERVVRPSTGFRFSYYYSINHYETFDCAFREGWIEINEREARYMTNQTIVSHINPATYTIGNAIVESRPNTDEDDEELYFPCFTEEEAGLYMYEIWMINDKYGGVPIGVKMTPTPPDNNDNNSDRIVDPINTVYVASGNFVRFSMVRNNNLSQSAIPIDGCFIIIKRTKIDIRSSVYVRMPVSHNGHFVDTGEWINGRKWGTTNLVPSSFSTMQNGDNITIYAAGNYKIRNSILLSGSTQNRPHNVTAGTMYYDTTLNKPIWVKSVTNGTPVWVNSSGAIV